MSSIAKKLTQKQRKFIDEYLVSGNATQSALKAGYSKRTAYRLADNKTGGVSRLGIIYGKESKVN